MTASKQVFPIVFLSGLAMSSFFVLMTAIKGDDTLRVILASVGFLGFASLLAALVVAKARAPKA